MRTKLALILLVVCLLTVACTSRAIDYEQVGKDEKLVIRFSHVVGEDTPKGQAARLFAKLINERTKGKVEVQVFANGSLYKDAEELEALNNGYIQMIAPALSKMSPQVPELGAFDLPFLYNNMAGYHQALDGSIGQQISTQFVTKGFEPLAFWDNGFKQFTNNFRPIIFPKDLENQKIRIMPSSVLDMQFALLKAKPMEMGFNDVYVALEKGHVDGEENTLSNIYTKRFYRIQKYMTISNHGYIGYVVLMNKKFWESLSPDLQRIMMDTMKEVTEWERKKALEINEKQFKLIEACKCIEIQTLSSEQKKQWKSLFQPLYQSIEAKLGKNFINQLREISQD